MAQAESQRWEAIYATCKGLEIQGVFEHKGMLYVLDECVEAMVKDSKERMFKLLEGMLLKLKLGGNTGEQALLWAKQQVDRWGALKHSQKLRGVITEAVRAEETMKGALRQVCEHANVEIRLKRGAENRERFSQEARVSKIC